MLTKKSKKIKICFVSMLGYPLYNRNCRREFFGGGAAVQLYILSREFSKNKIFDVNVITGNYNLTENKVELAKNIKIFNIRPIKRKISYYFLSLINFFIILVKIRPDIIIQRAADKITGVCAFYCKLFKKKFIYSIANITDVNGKNEKGFFGKFYRYGLNNASHIIAQNRDQIVELEKFKKRKFYNITTIQNSYEITKKLIQDKKYILWIARAINWKRPELFLKLAEKFPYEKFIMICGKTDEKVESLKYWKSVSDEALKISNLKFIKFVPFHKIDQFFIKTKIFINTSTFEGFPNTFIQAFTNMAPVISLNVNPDNLITEYRLGIWCNNDFNIMVENLKKLLYDEDIYQYYSQNCFDYVQQHHNVKENIKKWIEIIKS